MIKKIGNLVLETVPLSKCNLKAIENMAIYPLQVRVDFCPICGQRLQDNFVFAVQISKSQCVKISGASCHSCKAFFTQSSKLIEWLRIKKYNKGIPKILDTYNMNVDTLRNRKVFTGSESIFRQFLLMSENDIIAVLITFDRNDENRDNWIFHYLNPLAISLLKAEKEGDRHVSINGTNYTIVHIKRKLIEDKEVNNEILFTIETQIALSGKLPPFSSETTVYVYRGSIRCHSCHHMEEVRVILPSESNDFRFYAEYCHECKKYLMKYDDYETYLKRFKLFPSKVVLTGNSTLFDEFGRAEQSPLHLNGYSVGVEAGLSAKERQKILAYVVDYGILDKRKVLDYLEMFIATNIANKRFQSAIIKWQEDKQFLLDYSAQTVPLVVAGEVERLKR